MNSTGFSHTWPEGVALDETPNIKQRLEALEAYAMIDSFAELATITDASTGDIVVWWEKGFRYQCVPSGEHLDYTGSGGLKWKALPGNDGRINILALGCPEDGVTDCLSVFQTAATKGLSITVPEGTYAVDISGGTVASPARALWNQLEDITVYAVGAIFNLTEPTITELHADTDPSTAGYDAACVFSFIGCTNCHMIGGHYVGQWDGAEVLDLYGNEAPRVKAVAFSGCRRSSVRDISGEYVTGNLVNIRGSGGAIDGIYRRCEDTHAIACMARHCAENGINIMGGTFNCSVIGGEMSYNAANGVEVGGNRNAVFGVKAYANYFAGIGLGGKNHYIDAVVESSLHPTNESYGFGFYVSAGNGHVIRGVTRGCAREAAYILPNLTDLDIDISDVDSCAIAPSGGDNIIRAPTAISNSRIALRAVKVTTRATGTVTGTGTQDGRSYVVLDASASATLELYVGLPIKITGLDGGGTAYAIVKEYTTAKSAILDRVIPGIIAGTSAYVIGANGSRGMHITAPTKCELVVNGVTGYSGLAVLTDGTGSETSVRGYSQSGITLGTGATAAGFTRNGGGANENRFGEMNISGPIKHTGSTLGFYSATAIAKPTVTGSRGANAALASLLTALANLGLVTDSSS